MLDSTKNKLREAEFFYRGLSAAERRIMRNEPELFGYYLSAFLSAARSVADYLLAEEGERYRAWWAIRKQSLAENEKELLKFTNQERVNSVHVAGASVEHGHEYVSAHELALEMGANSGNYEVWSGPPGTPLPKSFARQRSFRRAMRRRCQKPAAAIWKSCSAAW
jgi:hypothetical protein